MPLGGLWRGSGKESKRKSFLVFAAVIPSSVAMDIRENPE
jgi:hypothetical protein